jgi:hypothetical protein
MVADKEGFDEGIAERIKLEAYGRSSNYNQTIDNVAEKIFEVA